MRSALLLLALFGIGCAPSKISISVPEIEAVDLLAVVLLDEAGQVVASTGLRPFSSGAALELEAGDGPDAARVRRALVAGWSLKSLESLGPITDERSQSPLSLASAQDPVLPAPTFSAEGLGSSSIEARRAPARELTAAWLPRCPEDLPTDLLVGLGCSPGACLTSATRSTCSLLVHTGECLLGDVVVPVDGRGALNFPAETRFGDCVPTAPRAPAVLSARCQPPMQETCAVDFFPAMSDLPAEVTTLTLSPAPYLNRDSFPRPIVTLLPSYALLGDRAVVSVWDRASTQQACSGRTGHLAIVDLERMVVTASVAAPRCLSFLAPDPNGPGFVGLFRDPDYAVARFDADGAMVEQRALGFIAADHTLESAALRAGPTGLAVVVQARDNDQLAVVQFLDAQTFAVTRTTTLATTYITDALWVEGTLWLLDGSFDRIVPVDPQTGVAAEGVRLQAGVAARGLDLAALAYLPGTHRFLATATSRLGGTVVASELESLGVAHLFQAVAHSVSGTQHPMDPSLALVGITDVEGEHTARITALDPTLVRFLPGTHPVGLGPVEQLRTDARGRVLGLLSWEGKLFRALLR